MWPSRGCSTDEGAFPYQGERRSGAQNRPLSRMFNCAAPQSRARSGLTTWAGAAFTPPPGRARDDRYGARARCRGAPGGDRRRQAAPARSPAPRRSPRLGVDGAPLTTWVGCASDFDGAPLFLFSDARPAHQEPCRRSARLAAADRPARARRSAQPPPRHAGRPNLHAIPTLTRASATCSAIPKPSSMRSSPISRSIV